MYCLRLYIVLMWIFDFMCNDHAYFVLIFVHGLKINHRFKIIKPPLWIPAIMRRPRRFKSVVRTKCSKLQSEHVSWEPEGRYCSSKMFLWEPEGRYCCTKSMAIAPFWLLADDVTVTFCSENIHVIWTGPQRKEMCDEKPASVYYTTCYWKDILVFVRIPSLLRSYKDLHFLLNIQNTLVNLIFADKVLEKPSKFLRK